MLPGYNARLVLDVENNALDAASLGFCFGGQVRDDGKDIRIVSVTGLPVKSQVLFCNPKGVSQIAFHPIPGMKRYYIYFNNPNETAALPEPWEPVSGLLLETRKSGGGQYYADKLEDLKLYWERSDVVLGKTFVATIFFGESPFKARGNIINYFKGYLETPEAGEYSFATSSLDSSFAVIDGTLVCQAPGAHDWTGGAYWAGKITLTKGVHILEYYHIQRDGPMQAVLAWKTPKGKGYEKIPETRFTPVAPVKIVGFEKVGLPFAADFDVSRTGDVLKGGTQATVYQFKARSWGAEKPTSFAWDFGDGTKGTGDTVEHVYFGQWEPTVQLTISKGSLSDRFARTIDIYPAEQGVDENKVLPQVEAIVKTYSARDLEPKNASALIRFLKGAKLNEAFVHVVEAQLNSPQGIPPDKMDEYLPLLADAYLDDGQFEKALQRYEEIIQKAGNSPSPEIKKARVRAAECVIHLGRFDEAMQRHDAILQSGESDRILTPVERSFMQDKVRAAIRQGKFDGARELLEEFILKYPVALQKDFTFYLRGKISFGEKKWLAAATDLAFVEHLESRSNYIPESLYLAGQCYLELGKRAEAQKALQRVAERYGNSEFAEPAKKLLASVQG